jgi:hypothetical protein
MFSQDYKFGKVSKEELSEKIYAQDSTANAAYLYNNIRTYYEYNTSTGFNVITEVHKRIKIYNKDGFDYATLNISYYKPESGDKQRVNSIKGYTFNLVDGEVKKTKLSKKNIFDEKLNKFRSKKKITMPNIKEGAIIELKYRIFSPFPSSLDDLQFQYNIPVKKLLHQIEIPEYLVFNQIMKGYYSLPLKKEVRNGRIGNDFNYVINVSKYEGQNIPALKDDEPYISNIYNYRGGVKFELTSTKYPNSMLKFYSTTWKDVVKTIYKSSNFGKELEKTSYFKDDLQVLLVKAKNDNEKINLIFDLVKSKVKWNEYNSKFTDVGVRKAYKNGVGNSADINLMLTSMLREAGLDANPILISTRSHGISFSPTREGFNYVIAGVQLQEKMIYLDATEKYSLPNVLPLRVINWRGRIIGKDKNSDWVDLIPKKHSVVENTLMINIDPEMEVKGMLRTIYKNSRAVNFRASNNHLKEEGVIEKVENNYGIEIDNYKVLNAKKINKPVVRNIKFSGEDLIEEINQKIYLSPLFFLSSKINPFKLKERKFPVDFGVPLRNKNTINIKIPKGYKVESVPKNMAVAISNNIGVFKYRVIASSTKLMIVSQLQINQAIITPEYYQELKEFYNQMVKKQTEKIVLIKE